ncbi:hypothetical protein QR680_004256 [Steinernema hermaphroditum]|uniref:Uncharacterized protein n=1 Tax=Steinernema hermaphroditum TaxID=289476 RepID=A0AA39LTQ1_9BILA|nr:hypothetical protein QR680_004256 [Steinernema hermaphroditum]
MYLPESNKLYSLKSHRTYDISDTGELAACFEHRSQIFHLKNLGGMTFLKSVHIDDTQTQETCNKNIIFCGTCFTLEHNGHLFTNEEIVDSSTKQASLASLCMPDNDAETLRTSIREAFISIIDEKITENFETLKGAFESMEVSKKRVQDDRSMTTSELEWNVEVIRKLTSTAERELERIEMWKERVLNAILTSNSE